MAARLGTERRAARELALETGHRSCQAGAASFAALFRSSAHAGWPGRAHRIQLAPAFPARSGHHVFRRSQLRLAARAMRPGAQVVALDVTVQADLALGNDALALWDQCLDRVLDLLAIRCQPRRRSGSSACGTPIQTAKSSDGLSCERSIGPPAIISTKSRYDSL